MSEEEKEVIKLLKEHFGLSYAEETILLNYISNLQKENEELKETLKCTQDSWFNDTQKLDKLQKELDLKDKVIEKTCRYINEAKIMNKAIPVYPNKKDTPYTVGVASIEEIKQYFYKKVEKVEEEKC